ncbi:MAG: putative soluble lytic murein transglycosylase-related protein [Caballeronia sp.]|jgi:Transglycosylase SLT domain|nr:putative soluble lytic murein transglycosylase-related protein [Caballeronia sp.]
MHGNQSEESRRRLRAKLALCAFLFMSASAAYANDATDPNDATHDGLVPDGQISASVEFSPGESLQVADVAAVLWRQFRVARREGTLIARAVISAANEYAMSPVLLLAVIATESGFDRQAVSVAGAQGLMQILPTAHPQVFASGNDLTEPAENVRIGSSILREYLDASGGDLGVALKRYSGGGKGYAQRVAFRMRQFSASLQTPPGGTAKVALARSP